MGLLYQTVWSTQMKPLSNLSILIPHSQDTKQILHKNNKCLTYTDNSVTLEPCDPDEPLTQQWTWKQIKPRL